MKILGYEVHPAAAVFELLSEPELALLAEDIKARGLIEKITLHKDVLLDGRNRLRACKLAGVDPRFDEWRPKTDDPEKEEIDWIVSKNLRRRHLSESQRGMVGADLLPVYEAAAKKRMVAGGGDKRSGRANLPTPVPAQQCSDFTDSRIQT